MVSQNNLENHLDLEKDEDPGGNKVQNIRLGSL
jgi:hypothetical protein